MFTVREKNGSLEIIMINVPSQGNEFKQNKENNLVHTFLIHLVIIKNTFIIFILLSFSFFSPAIGEPVKLEWFNPQGERITSSRRMSLHTEMSRSKLIIYNAIIEDAGIYRCQATDARGHTEEASVVLEIYRKPPC